MKFSFFSVDHHGGTETLYRGITHVGGGGGVLGDNIYGSGLNGGAKVEGGDVSNAENGGQTQEDGDHLVDSINLVEFGVGHVCVVRCDGCAQARPGLPISAPGRDRIWGCRLAQTDRVCLRGASPIAIL